MTSTRTTHCDGEALLRGNEVFLWIGVIFCLGNITDWEWLFQRPGPSAGITMPDCITIVATVSSLILLFADRSSRPVFRATFMLGWIHACVLLFLAVSAASLSQVLFAIAPIMAQSGPGHVYLVGVVPSVTRGVCLYFVGSALVFVGFRCRRGIPLPSYGLVLLIYLVLWLAVALATGNG
jgi:hypothetical protein